MNDRMEGPGTVCSSPEGYPLPSSKSGFKESFTFPSFSSNTHPCKQASLMTLAATLAAPTILNLESALLVTVKSMPGKREER